MITEAKKGERIYKRNVERVLEDVMRDTIFIEKECDLSAMLFKIEDKQLKKDVVEEAHKKTTKLITDFNDLLSQIL